MIKCAKPQPDRSLLRDFTKRNLWSCNDCGQLINERWLKNHKCPKKGETKK